MSRRTSHSWATAFVVIVNTISDDPHLVDKQEASPHSDCWLEQNTDPLMCAGTNQILLCVDSNVYGPLRDRHEFFKCPHDEDLSLFILKCSGVWVAASRSWRGAVTFLYSTVLHFQKEFKMWSTSAFSGQNNNPFDAKMNAQQIHRQVTITYVDAWWWTSRRMSMCVGCTLCRINI